MMLFRSQFEIRISVFSCANFEKDVILRTFLGPDILFVQYTYNFYTHFEKLEYLPYKNNKNSLNRCISTYLT